MGHFFHVMFMLTFTSVYVFRLIQVYARRVHETYVGPAEVHVDAYACDCICVDVYTYVIQLFKFIARLSCMWVYLYILIHRHLYVHPYTQLTCINKRIYV